MELYYKVKALVMEYIVTHNEVLLEKTITALRQEIDDPSIQGATITHDSLTIEKLDEMVRIDNFLRFSVEEVTNIAPLEFDKFIRVFGCNSVDDGALILKVVHMDGRTIILVPFGPTQSDESEPS